MSDTNRSITEDYQEEEPDSEFKSQDSAHLDIPDKGQLDTNMSQAQEMEKEVDTLKIKFKTIKQELQDLKELSMLKHGNKNILEGISKHVVNTGLAAKIKDLRRDFFSKADFKNETMKLLTKSDLEFLKKDTSN